MITTNDTRRLLDLYDLAHLQVNHDVVLDLPTMARVHPMKTPGRPGAALSNYSQLVRRLVAYAASVGIALVNEGGGKGHDIRLRFPDGRQALETCGRLLDTLAPSEHDLDIDEGITLRRAA